MLSRIKIILFLIPIALCYASNIPDFSNLSKSDSSKYDDFSKKNKFSKNSQIPNLTDNANLSKSSTNIDITPSGVNIKDYFNDGVNEAKIGKNYFQDYEKNIVNPITKDKNTTTIDNKTTFSAGIACDEKSVKILAINYQLNYNYSPLIKVDFFDDTQNIINSFEPNLPAAGICSNGIMVCQNDSISKNNKCDHYMWDYNVSTNELQLNFIPEKPKNQQNATEKINFSKSSMLDCMCVNNSCAIQGSSISARNKKAVLEKISSGITSVLTTSLLKDYILSNGKFDGNEYIIMGQKISNCNNFQGEITNVGPKPSSSKIEDMVDYKTEETRQLKDKNSPLHSFKNHEISTLSSEDESYQYYNESQSFTDKGIKTSGSVKEHAKQIGNTPSFSVEGAMPNNSGLSGTLSIDLNDYNKTINENTFCKVKVPKYKTTVYTDNTTPQSEKNDKGLQYDQEVRECVNGGKDCPYDFNIGEILVQNCSKTKNDMAKGLAKMQVINDASKDMICH